ncbi:MAG: S41 family peptidase [Flavobacteriaceae bacterium]|nr:S41 family peptidase [Flavobacteriaceae bacterium]
MSTAEKNAVIESIKISIDSNYVFVEKSKALNKKIDSLYATGNYGRLNDPKVFASTLTDDLVAVTNDKHFVVQYRPDLVRSEAENEEGPIQEPEPEEPAIDLNYWYAQKGNFGFEKVEILEGNIGYVKLTFFDLFEWAKPTIDATMGFVSNTDALIIDLRGNGGGCRSATYLASYFFDEEPVLWFSSYNRTRDAIESDYTYAQVDGPRYLDKPVYILIDAKSFSRAEGFAYGLKHLDKAIIVGQTTPGAAHGINFVELAHGFFIQIPVELNIHPVTKTDWEGIGVIPHVPTEKGESYGRAYEMALDTLMTTKRNPALGIHFDKLMERYKKIKAGIDLNMEK